MYLRRRAWLLVAVAALVWLVAIAAALPGTAGVRGHLIAQGGPENHVWPLPNVAVQALLPGTQTVVAHTLTDAQSDFVLDLPPGRYDLRTSPRPGRSGAYAYAGNVNVGWFGHTNVALVAAVR